MFFFRIAQLLLAFVLVACLSCMSQALAQDKDKLLLPYVPKEANAVVAVRPAALLKSRDFQQFEDAGQKVIKRTIGQIARNYYKLSLTELDGIEQITIAAKAPSKNANPPDSGLYDCTIIRTVSDNKDKFELATHDVEETIKYKDTEYLKAKQKVQGISGYIWIADKKTIIYSSWQKGIEAAIDQGKKDPADAEWFNRWKSVGDKHFAISISKDLLALAVSDYRRVGINLPLDFSSLEKIDNVVGDLTFGKQTEIYVHATCGQAGDAKDVAQFAEQGLELLWQTIRRQQQSSDFPSPDAFTTIFGELVKSTKITTKGKLVTVSAQVTLDFEKLKPMFESTHLALQRSEAANNLRQVSVGLHDYHDATGHMMPSVLVSKYGKKYSWRIAILPYIDEKELYEQYRFDEDWDSPHNSKVTAKMPDFFRSVSDDKESTNSSWYMLTGPGGAVNDDGPMTLEELSKADGTSQTIVAVEAKRNVHWAKPEDIVVDPKQGMPKLGGFHKGGFNVTFGDASVFFVNENVAPEVLWSMFTARGGEAVDKRNWKVTLPDK